MLIGGAGGDTFMFDRDVGVATTFDFGDRAGDQDVIRLQGSSFSNFGELAASDAMT